MPTAEKAADFISSGAERQGRDATALPTNCDGKGARDAWPFNPGALKPEWEGDPAHAQTVAATDKQIEGFNDSADPVEWVVYFTNPKTGARAQMFAVLRPYPEMRPAPSQTAEAIPPQVRCPRTPTWTSPHRE